MDRRRRAARTVALMSLFAMTDTQADVPIASFDGDGSDLISLSVGIEPLQAGSGDPSPDNVRPISGWTGAKVTRTGKNLADSTYGDKVPSVLNGQMVSANGWSTPFIKIDNAKEYTFSFTASANRYVLFYDSTQNYLGYVLGINNVYHLSSYEKYAQVGYVKLRIDSGSDQNPLLQLAQSTTATTYEPYQDETYSITFPTSAGTVYGGTLDVTTGKLTVDMAMIAVGGINWSMYNVQQGNLFRSPVIVNANLPYDDINVVCSHYRTSTTSQRANGTISVGSVNRVDIIDSNYSTADAFKAAMSGAQIVYPLATPIEYDLTPTQVTTLIGTNNIWADTGDIKYIEYNI